jgi:hypothetical protein
MTRLNFSLSFFYGFEFFADNVGVRYPVHGISLATFRINSINFPKS